MVARDGQIVTFYSYKGGTGRSMMLANVAWILASNGSRVLAVDWDLEAPGLHRYFQPFLLDDGLRASDGVIDFVATFTSAAREPQTTKADEDWFVPYADLTQLAVPLDWDFDSGRLDYVGAGRQGPTYSLRVASFDWGEFYDDFGGGAFLACARGHLKRHYDYVLIDSRTGLSDTSGICTVQMPDSLVVCFTLNNQSVTGAAEVADSIRRQRGADLRILSVPMRIDNSEKLKLDLRRRAALERFSTSADAPSLLERRWAEVEVGYQPFYAYEEVLATFGDTPGRSNTVLAAAECLTSWVSEGEVKHARRVSEPRRREVLARYEGVSAVPSVTASKQTVYISYRRGDRDYVGPLYDELSRQLGPGRVVMDVDLAIGVDLVAQVDQAIEAAAVVLVVIGPYWLDARDPDVDGDLVASEMTAAFRADKRVVPVLVGGVSVRQLHQLEGPYKPLARRNAIELSEAQWGYDVRRLAAAIELAIAGISHPSDSSSGPVASPYPPSFTSAEYRPSPESLKTIDAVLSSRRSNTVWLSVSVITTIVSVVVAVLVLINKL